MNKIELRIKLYKKEPERLHDLGHVVKSFELYRSMVNFSNLNVDYFEEPVSVFNNGKVVIYYKQYSYIISLPKMEFGNLVIQDSEHKPRYCSIKGWVDGSYENDLNRAAFEIEIVYEEFLDWYGTMDVTSFEDSPYRIKLIETMKMIGQNLIDNAEDYIPKNTKYLSEIFIGEIDISMNDTIPLISIRTNYVPDREQLVKIMDDDMNRRKGEQLKED